MKPLSLRSVAKGVTTFFIISQFFFLFSLKIASVTPVEAVTTSFTQAFMTLNNSRLSHASLLSVGLTSGVTNITIGSTDASHTDQNTLNLFPGDTICLNNPLGPNADGCSGNTTYTVNTVPTSTQFSTTVGLGNTVQANDAVIATQSGRMTLTFTPRTAVNSGGFLRLLVASATGVGVTTSNGIPDATGFDSGDLPSNLLSGSNPTNTVGCVNQCYVPTGFTVSAATLIAGTSGAGSHTILGTLSSNLIAGSSYSLVIGHATDTTLRLLNPLPLMGHSRGVADTYNISIQSEDSSNNAIDKTIMRVAPIDGVLVSATVELTLTYTIGALGTSNTACNITSNVATTATSVPFGSITTFDGFYDAIHTHTVTTNAANGYVLGAYQDGPMSLDGLGVTTIANTTCDAGTCTPTTSAAWATGSNNGFGYTLANGSGTDAAFTFSAGYRSFTANPAGVTIMSNTGPVAASQTYSCYRLSVDTTQRTGYYFNKLTYIATPRF